MTNPLDTLRPEVQKALDDLSYFLTGTHNHDDFYTIRAELLRLTRENDEWQTRCLQFQTERDKAWAELAAAQNTIAAQQGTMGALKRKLALAEGELAALKARIADGPSTQVSRMAAIGGGSYEWAGCRVPDTWNGKRVRLVVEE